MMTKNEIDILIKIANNKCAFRQLMNSRVAIVHPYFGYLMDSLLKRGYLKGSRESGYQLTLKSNKAIMEHFRANGGNSNSIHLRHIRESIAKDAIKKIGALGAKCGNKMEYIQNYKCS